MREMIGMKGDISIVAFLILALVLLIPLGFILKWVGSDAYALIETYLGQIADALKAIFPGINLPAITTTTTSGTGVTTTTGSVGTPGCPSNQCLSDNPNKNGVEYPPCSDVIIITDTDPANPNSCDSPKNIYEFVHDSTKLYLDVYDADNDPYIQTEISNQLVAVDFLGLRVRIHNKVAPKLREVGSIIDSNYPHSGSTYQFPSGTYTFINGGSYNFRRNVNNPTVLSSHSFGVALDLSPQTNWGNVLQPMACIIDMPPEVVKTFESVGFRWGGRYWPSFDPMHFEYIPTCIV